MADGRPKLGRRKRRLRRVLWLICGLVVAAALVGWGLYRASRPETWTSGETTDEITENLSRDLPEGAPLPRFEDVTETAGLAGFDTFFGVRSSQLPEDMGSGVAWGDFDNDGDDDLFLVSAGGSLTADPETWTPSQLYRNQGRGGFDLVAEFPETRMIGMGAAWGDYDGDGWLDLVVSGYRRLSLFRNQEGTLVPGPELPGGDRFWSGVSWADFDGDRDLDLYVAGYVDYVEDDSDVRRATDQYGTAVPYTLNPASFEPVANMLLRNDGGRFTDVAALYGVSNPEGRSLGALWQDFDADGRLDLYVANDISDNALYLNRGDTFEDAGLSAWVADYRGAMGLTSGDWNRDGDDDLFVTHWLAQENALYESRLVETAQGAPAGAQRLTFADLAAPKGVGQIALQMVGWGTEFGDLDNDGWLDLVVANGSTLEEKDGSKELKRQPAMLLWNQGGDFFHDLAAASPPFAAEHAARGLALSDYDLDGDLDVAMVHLDSGVALLRNDTETGNWIELELKAQNGGRGEHSLVVVKAGAEIWRRTVTSASYLSQSSAVVHVGLGEAQVVDDVEVRWKGGDSQWFTNLQANSRYRLTEGDDEALRLASNHPASERAVATLDERQRTLDFWAAQRAGMDAMKRDGDCNTAVTRFEEALALNPSHGDARYYLANCLAALDQTQRALDELARMRVDHPGSQRAHRRWAVLKALTATTRSDVEDAAEAASSALAINQEETGSVQLLGELDLMLGDADAAAERFDHVLQTNDRAIGSHFLLAYLDWLDGQDYDGRVAAIRAARGPDWKPEGAVAEGDVATRMHSDETPLSGFWQRWDGATDIEDSFRQLRGFLSLFVEVPPNYRATAGVSVNRP